VNKVIDGGTNLYVRAVNGALRFKWVMLLVFVLALGATYWVYKAVPGSFVPAEDEGYFITIVQAPSGSSIEYTTNIMKQAEGIYGKQEEVAGVFSVAGFSFSGAASNSGLMFTRLKAFEERKGSEHSLEAVLNRTRGQLMGIPGALVIPVAPPAIQGLSAFGGFQFEVLDSDGRRHY
jgi:HAE1 family hydrophobic/amphiphilic exporter-1